MTRRLKILSALFSAAATTTFSFSAWAQSQAVSPFAGEDSDWAIAWINYLFRGKDLPGSMAAYGTRLAPMADGLRQALGLYSMGMLILAVILLFYHITTAIVDTAHEGVPFGRRFSQSWAPIRLIVAILLLVPVGSGLSSGQYLVIKIAEEGSSLASNAWRTVINAMGGNFTSLVTPAPPNIAALVGTATEMEICRLLYQQSYGTPNSESPLRYIGNIGELTHMPASNISDETWMYTNALNAGTPMCGAYRFPGYRRHGQLAGTDSLGRMSDDLSLFSHTEAESIIVQSRVTAQHAVAAIRETNIPASFNIQGDLTGLEKSIRADLNTHLQALDSVNSTLTNGMMTGPSQAGWVAAIVFIPEFIRLQESYGELVSHILPVAQGPVFGHPALAQKTLAETLAVQPAFNVLDRTSLNNLAQFYAQVSASTSLAHGWIFGSQLGDADYVPPSGFDIHDQLNVATDPSTAFALFARALDTAAIANGVWGMDGRQVDSGNPFAAPAANVGYNPLTSLIEYGRRQYALGLYMTGLAGGALTVPMATTPAVLTAGLGLVFLLGGLGLIFLVPLVPFLRFLFVVLVWLLDLFEAIAAMPVVALAHLTPTGEGLSGGAAKQAYLLWIGLLVRPILSLFGLILGFLLFAIGTAFLGIVLGPFAHMAASSNSGILIVANTGLIILYDVLTYIIANAAFKGIYLLPDQALRWITPLVVTERGDSPAQTATPIVNMPPSPLLAQVTTHTESLAGGHKDLGYGLRSQSALFPINQVERRVDSTPYEGADTVEMHYSQGGNMPASLLDKETPVSVAATSVSSATATSTTTSTTTSAGVKISTAVPTVAPHVTPVTLASIAAKETKEDKAAREQAARSPGKTSPYTNVPFFQNKDKP